MRKPDQNKHTENRPRQHTRGGSERPRMTPLLRFKRTPAPAPVPEFPPPPRVAPRRPVRRFFARWGIPLTFGGMFAVFVVYVLVIGPAFAGDPRDTGDELLDWSCVFSGCDESTPEDPETRELVTVYVELPDGRELLCVKSTRQSSGDMLSCDWDSVR